jgi:hypothetical protein
LVNRLRYRPFRGLFLYTATILGFRSRSTPRLHTFARYRGLGPNEYQRPVLYHNCSQVSRLQITRQVHSSSRSQPSSSYNIF